MPETPARYGRDRSILGLTAIRLASSTVRDSVSKEKVGCSCPCVSNLYMCKHGHEKINTPKLYACPPQTYAPPSFFVCPALPLQVTAETPLGCSFQLMGYITAVSVKPSWSIAVSKRFQVFKTNISHKWVSTIWKAKQGSNHVLDMNKSKALTHSHSLGINLATLWRASSWGSRRSQLFSPLSRDSHW